MRYKQDIYKYSHANYKTIGFFSSRYKGKTVRIVYSLFTKKTIALDK